MLAIDADPDANLATALGVPNPESITPISDMKELVAERTESTPGKMGGFFKLNPKVDDIPDKFSTTIDGVKLMVLGGGQEGGQRLYLSGERALAAPGDAPGFVPG